MKDWLYTTLRMDDEADLPKAEKYYMQSVRDSGQHRADSRGKEKLEKRKDSVIKRRAKGR